MTSDTEPGKSRYEWGSSPAVRPEDIARWACGLLDKENGWITGQVLVVDGGMGELRPLK